MVTGPEEGGLGRPDRAHPLAGQADLVGRVVTAFDPDGYVLVDGLLVRAVPAASRPSIGDDVMLTVDPAGTLLRASPVGRAAAE